MATRAQCEAALAVLASRLTGVDDETRRRHALDRTLACRVEDLDLTFVGELHDGRLDEVRVGDGDGAQIRLALTSDDLVELTDGRLNFAHAWARGRVRIDASVLDLLRLRSLL
ncbi:MAG TPA: SCP2 sterol-binding domain-containing protein [Mycobacteriales bacterium]|nr:SCP2 sterol-binding domain-containing protein [Mycobacteriales bacterium]